MPNTFAIQGWEGTRKSFPRTRRPLSGMEQPGAFQCMLLRAFELPKVERDVFLLREIQGHSFPEIAAILGISVDTVHARLKRARRTIGRLGHSDAMEHA